MDMHHNMVLSYTAHSTTLEDSWAYLHLLDGTDINKERRLYYKELKKVTVVLSKQCNSLSLTNALQNSMHRIAFPKGPLYSSEKQSNLEVKSLHKQEGSDHFGFIFKKKKYFLTSPSSNSTSRKSKSLNTRNCCSDVVSSMFSVSRVPSSEDTRLGWCSIRSSSPQDEKITCRKCFSMISDIFLNI